MDFGADVASAGIDLFFIGFEECKLKMAACFPSVDLSRILPLGEEGGDEEHPGDEEGEGAVEVKVAVDQAVEAPARVTDLEVVVQLSDPEITTSVSNPGVEHVEAPSLHNYSGVLPMPSELAQEGEVVADP